jgi:hypothetical protein
MAAEETSAENAPPAPKKRGRLTPLLVVGALMLGEGVGVFLLAKVLSPPPPPALAMEGGGAAGDNNNAASGDLVEVDLGECRPSNKMSGKFVTFQIRVSGLVDPKKREAVQEMIRARQARIDDAVNVVIRGAQPSELNEPGLETIRRRLKHELGGVFGDDELIHQVLIPQMLQSGPGL